MGFDYNHNFDSGEFGPGEIKDLLREPQAFIRLQLRQLLRPYDVLAMNCVARA